MVHISYKIIEVRTIIYNWLVKRGRLIARYYDFVCLWYLVSNDTNDNEYNDNDNEREDRDLIAMHPRVKLLLPNIRLLIIKGNNNSSVIFTFF